MLAPMIAIVVHKVGPVGGLPGGRGDLPAWILLAGVAVVCSAALLVELLRAGGAVGDAPSPSSRLDPALYVLGTVVPAALALDAVRDGRTATGLGWGLGALAMLVGGVRWWRRRAAAEG